MKSPDEQLENLQRIIEEDERASRSIAQQLYDSEINFEVAAFWDGGFTVKLGDPLNGYVAEANLKTWGDVEAWLIQQALAYYPDSAFAREHGSGSNVVALRSEGRKDPEAADRLVRDMGFDPNNPTG